MKGSWTDLENRRRNNWKTPTGEVGDEETKMCVYNLLLVYGSRKTGNWVCKMKKLEMEERFLGMKFDERRMKERNEGRN